jgi:hypothetical protein
MMDLLEVIACLRKVDYGNLKQIKPGPEELNAGIVPQ